MIQRKQTIFLLISLVLTIVCLCLPLCKFSLLEDAGDIVMYNLWIVTPTSHDASIWALFAILLVTCPISLFTIFAFHNRIAQSRLCLFNILLIIGYYAVLFILLYGYKQEYGSPKVEVTLLFPLVAAIFYFLSRRAILKDEALVRSIDRIR